ncbi:MAG: hypothetical protein ACK5L7_06435 [Paludibacteraceae bacterium]
MSSFHLYKKRDFGTYISDTSDFFKKFWKNYFKNFVVINGAMMLILCLIYYFIFKDTFSSTFSGRGITPQFLYDENIGIFIVLISVAMLVAVVFSLFLIAFPIAYLQLIDKTDRDNFTSSEIFNQIKPLLGRIFLFGLISLLILVPIALVTAAVASALILIIIGIPILVISMGILMVWYMQSLFVYLNEDKGYFEALKAGWQILFGRFWPIVGSTLIITLAVYILSTIVTFIPSMMTIGSIFSTGTEPDISKVMPAMSIVYVLNILLSYLLYNLIYVNQGLIYYGSKEETEHISAFSEIDNIGKNAE